MAQRLISGNAIPGYQRIFSGEVLSTRDVLFLVLPYVDSPDTVIGVAYFKVEIPNPNFPKILFQALRLHRPNEGVTLLRRDDFNDFPVTLDVNWNYGGFFYQFIIE